MTGKINIEADKAWEYFEEHKDELEDTMLNLAENDANCVTIYLASDNGEPVIYEDIDGEVVNFLSDFTCEEELEAVLQEIYDSDIFTDDDIVESFETIEERELELDEAVYYMMEVFVPDLEEIAENPDEIYEDIKDIVSEWLYTEHGISIYRPMYLEDDGRDSYFEYPYSEMELG